MRTMLVSGLVALALFAYAANADDATPPAADSAAATPPAGTKPDAAAAAAATDLDTPDPLAPLADAIVKRRTDPSDAKKLAELLAARKSAREAVTPIQIRYAQVAQVIVELRKKLAEMNALDPATPGKDAAVANQEKLIAGQQEQLDEVAPEKEKAEKALDQATKRYNKEAGPLSGSAKDAKADVVKLREYIKNLQLMDDFKTLDIKGIELQEQLQALERKLDQSNMGAYVREKLTRAFESEAFCKAEAACKKAGSERTKAYQDVDQEMEQNFFNKEGGFGRKRDGESSTPHSNN